ncbi:hypothetical protein FB567DRAFT_546992 [Paraphoma chrysanthemicola]|uniref:Uncharacterized protein n=1 Tax=Paraphoma chrysanthemicola TaxID=798071 RepID=A0A8K0R9Q7_9PLEO|nr:hypothetical protein FB567DRAFT_546992 [Paraphoma chrysanthemicola]
MSVLTPEEGTTRCCQNKTTRPSGPLLLSSSSEVTDTDFKINWHPAEHSTNSSSKFQSHHSLLHTSNSAAPMLHHVLCFSDNSLGATMSSLAELSANYTKRTPIDRSSIPAPGPIESTTTGQRDKAPALNKLADANKNLQAKYAEVERIRADSQTTFSNSLQAQQVGFSETLAQQQTGFSTILKRQQDNFTTSLQQERHSVTQSKTTFYAARSTFETVLSTAGDREAEYKKRIAELEEANKTIAILKRDKEELQKVTAKQEKTIRALNEAEVNNTLLTNENLRLCRERLEMECEVVTLRNDVKQANSRADKEEALMQLLFQTSAPDATLSQLKGNVSDLQASVKDLLRIARTTRDNTIEANSTLSGVRDMAESNKRTLEDLEMRQQPVPLKRRRVHDDDFAPNVFDDLAFNDDDNDDNNGANLDDFLDIDDMMPTAANNILPRPPILPPPLVPLPPLAIPHLDQLKALQDDGTMVPFANLSAAVKNAVQTFLSAHSNWHAKLTKSKGKSCLETKSMANHAENGVSVACKQCAYNHHFCIKKKDDDLVLTPLCAIDCQTVSPPPTIDDVAFFRLPDTIKFAPSKRGKTYESVHR